MHGILSQILVQIWGTQSRMVGRVSLLLSLFSSFSSRSSFSSFVQEQFLHQPYFPRMCVCLIHFASHFSFANLKHSLSLCLFRLYCMVNFRANVENVQNAFFSMLAWLLNTVLYFKTVRWCWAKHKSALTASTRWRCVHFSFSTTARFFFSGIVTIDLR